MDLSDSHIDPAEDDAARYALYKEAVVRNAAQEGTIPHCDGRILHAPSECEYCNRPGLTTVRELLGIAFTGHQPVGDQIPCQADLERPPWGEGDHRRWAGNKPTSASEHPEDWPEETAASKALYGGPFWQDLNEDLLDPEFEAQFMAAAKRQGPWYMKPVCHNDTGTTVGYEFKWWAKPIRWWLWRR